MGKGRGAVAGYCAGELRAVAVTRRSLCVCTEGWTGRYVHRAGLGPVGVGGSQWVAGGRLLWVEGLAAVSNKGGCSTSYGARTPPCLRRQKATRLQRCTVHVIVLRSVLLPCCCRWSFCGYTLSKHTPQSLVVHDALTDGRFCDNAFGKLARKPGCHLLFWYVCAARPVCPPYKATSPHSHV